MPLDGSGTYSLPAGTTVSSGATITVTWANTFTADLLTVLNTARPVALGGTGATTAAGARTNFGLEIGTDVQGYSATLALQAGLTPAADRLPYYTGSGTADLATFTSTGQAVVAAATAADARTALGLVIGTDVQAYSADYLTTVTTPLVTQAEIDTGTETAGRQTTPKLIADNRGEHLISSWTHSSNVTTIPFTDLGDYDQITVVIVDAARTGATGLVKVQVSFDNGATYQTASYNVSVQTGDNDVLYGSGIGVFEDAATTYHTAELKLSRFNKSTKTTVSGRCFASSSSASICGTTPAGIADALQINSGGSSFTTGSIYIYGVKG